MSNNKLQTPFGLRDNQLIHISEVKESGLKCNCTCPGCGDKLSAKHFRKEPKDYKRDHTDHFAHSTNKNCNFGVESLLHLFAKDILLKEKRVVLPELIAEVGDNGNQKLSEKYELFADKVEIEKSIKDIRPDVLFFKDGKRLAIEIYVTHEVDLEKEKKFQEYDVSAIEIKLDHLIDKVDNLKILRRCIIEETDKKRWIYNSTQQALIENKLAELEAKQDKNSKENDLEKNDTTPDSSQSKWGLILGLLGVGVTIYKGLNKSKVKKYFRKIKRKKKWF